MGNESKNKGASSLGGGGGGFRAKMEHYVYSGEKKHVFAGIGIITIIFGIPWYLMNQGSKHRSHQDYMEKADKARKARLSSSSSSSSSDK
uniref:GAG1At protein n=1 Tax=Noccaea caerulescens TaxID=107243 RepID=A0A1J3JE66_NOCCA